MARLIMTVFLTERELIDETHEVVKNMRADTSGFYGNLGGYLSEALIRADLTNIRKIRNTWPVRWEMYLNWNKVKPVLVSGWMDAFDENDLITILEAAVLGLSEEAILEEMDLSDDYANVIGDKIRKIMRG